MIEPLRRRLAFAGGLAAGLLRPERLSSLVLFVSGDCTARCPHCFNVRMPHLRKEGRPARPPLTLEEYGLVADRLFPLFQTVLSGGEPFLREDLGSIVETFYVRAGTRLFSIPTNGSLAYRALRQLDRMSERCPDATFNLSVSLDALAERHDALRRLPGVFAKALSLCRGVLALKERRGNVNLVVSTAVVEENLDDVPALIRFLRGALPIGGWHHNVQYDQRLGSRLARDPALRLKVREIEDRASGPADGLIDRWYVRGINALILRQLFEGRMLYRCAAGKKIAVIMPDGETSPCEPFVFEDRYRELPRFNIRDHAYDYAALRKDPAFARVLRFIGDEGCSACPWSCAATASMVFDPRNWRRLFAR